ncbi:TetR/AcrR family transcriptional regulator C-terminal domain-containing protein [Streptomyces sp. SPB4]|uniref:TetR/AcrR family transcriptional regulator n=1 Tax=Streptomyces sp. SPB4 TaxID=2940553 RepID=UPI002474F956|nr:TetR/AcrR family transcriptional regulator C-terminal domain-containing protein [Streptomyces sp. SPB4]MDH6543532.1 AcrR family transcriptional regulator [Streptomyces sp. SPB4]
MLIWERPEPAARSSLSPLSRDRIVRAAVGLADDDGLTAVSLRKVAAALDAGPMRLYRYVDTKEELLDLMVDAVYAEIPLPGPGEDDEDDQGDGGDWEERVRSLAHGLRAAALRHEWFADLLGGRPQFGPATLGHLEAVLAALRRAPGIDDDDPNALMRALQAVNGYVLGAVRHEIVETRVERESGQTERQWQAASGPYLWRLIATGRYPSLAHLVTRGGDQDAAAMFTAGLDVILTGLAAPARPGAGAGGQGT